MLGALAREWVEIGGLGRLSLLGVLASAVLAFTLGWAITDAARSHLLIARTSALEVVARELAARFPDPGDLAPGSGFDAAARERLLGGETVLVKVWDPAGRILYSDDGDLIDRTFPLTEPAVAAFAGEPASAVSDLADPAHAEHRSYGSLIEIYLPFQDHDGVVVSVLEIEQRTDLLEEALGRITRDVWIRIGTGLAVLGLFLGTLFLVHARDLNRRRRRAEAIVGDLLAARDDERRRIVGALHDDVGQPLYRLLYGLEGTRARLPAGDPLRAELASLSDLVKRVDGTLRAEMRLLRHETPDDVGLGEALRDLVATVSAETELDITLDLASAVEPDRVPGQVLFRVIAEALTNVRRHAGASSVVVSVHRHGQSLTGTVVDDGVGAGVEPGIGLTTARERLEAIGGTLDVAARAGRGTTVQARIPLRLEAGS